MRWSWQWISTPPKRAGANLYTLELTDIPGLEVEENMPPEDELRARVDFIYSRDQVQETVSERYWKKASKDANGFLDSFVNRRGAMQAALAQIVSPTDSAAEKARKIYARVQQLRNLDYEPHRTEQEKERDKVKAAKDLNNAEDVWKSGYGTEQQLSLLFLALVRAAGIEAHGLMVANRSLNFFHPEAMNAEKLSAFVVVLRLDGHDVYCDPGIPLAPFGQLAWQVAGSPGLRIDRDGGAWITTPLPSSGDSEILRKADLTLAGDGLLEGHVVVTYTGLDASERRFEHRHDDATARKKLLEGELQRMVPVASEATLINQPDWSASTTTLVAEFNLTIPGYAVAVGRRILLQPAYLAVRKSTSSNTSTAFRPSTISIPAPKSMTSLSTCRKPSAPQPCPRRSARFNPISSASSPGLRHSPASFTSAASSAMIFCCSKPNTIPRCRVSIAWCVQTMRSRSSFPRRETEDAAPAGFFPFSRTLSAHHVCAAEQHAPDGCMLSPPSRCRRTGTRQTPCN